MPDWHGDRGAGPTFISSTTHKAAHHDGLPKLGDGSCSTQLFCSEVPWPVRFFKAKQIKLHDFFPDFGVRILTTSCQYYLSEMS